MGLTVSDVLHLLSRSDQVVDEVLRQGSLPVERAGRLTAGLHDLCPQSSVCACALRVANRFHVSLRDGTGKERPDWSTAVHVEVTEPPAGKQAASVLPAVAELAGHVELVEMIAVDEQTFGILALALPRGCDAETHAVLRAVLARWAARLALRLRLEKREQELTAQLGKGDVGEVAGSIAHEFNNWLNTLLLHVAVLEREVPEASRPGLQTIRQQSKHLAALIKEWQRYRQGQHPSNTAFDLNEAVRDAVGNEAFHLELARSLPLAAGSVVDGKRLVRFLVSQAATLSASGADGVTVRTRTQDDHVRLHVEIERAAATDDEIAPMFDLAGRAPLDARRLELAACDTLTRRLQGRLGIEKLPGDGITIHVELPEDRSKAP